MEYFWPFSSPSKAAAAGGADGAAGGGGGSGNSGDRPSINGASTPVVSSMGRPLPNPARNEAQVGPDLDIYKYLVGAWKRNLEWREFGHEFGHLRESNSIVVVEEYHRVDSEIGARYHRWSFGKSLQRGDLRGGYVMKMTSQPKSGEVQLEWTYSGIPCTGRFVPAASVLVLQFMLKTAVIMATYRIIDQNMMAVCIVEADDKKEPSIQYGNMYRLDPSAYSNAAALSNDG